ncbi:TetR/AcrR family transcriptional regulator [Amycolatopsis sp. NBC_00348]|uniref:TetR/AcrR family transcriptional regulator n=1 Tax=Amycolatopsis sp. NBC_00348 TaxID=2975956 RepID=UPI002E2576EC
MARPREFDESAAVDSAMHAFWEHGYEATSTQDLCDATGLGRSSVYNTFTSKKALFERSLTHYTDSQLTARQALLEGPGTAAERLTALFTTTIDAELERDRRGCLVVNTLAELGMPDDGIGAALRSDTERNLAMLGQCAREGVLDGSLLPGRDPADVAQFVLNTVTGLKVMSRRGTSREAMYAVADLALSALVA